MGKVLHPGARIAKAMLEFRAEAMQALADAAMQISETSRLSMKSIIASEREKQELSLQEVADRAGITKSHMWEIEQGRSVNPTVRTVYGLAKALGVPFVSMAAGALSLRLERIHEVARKALFPRVPETNERHELLDEIARLRAALKEISEHGYDVENDDEWTLKQIARKALGIRR